MVRESRHPPVWPGFNSQTQRHMWVAGVCWFFTLLQEDFLWVNFHWFFLLLVNQDRGCRVILKVGGLGFGMNHRSMRKGGRGQQHLGKRVGGGGLLSLPTAPGTVSPISTPALNTVGT